MKCKLCLKNEADKKNTHILTDSIIRTALNENGINKREKGNFWIIKSTEPFINYGFQRMTATQNIEKNLGRTPTEIEIEQAKSNPFSVDNIFCSDCEKHFTKIEEKFNSVILPLIKKSNNNKNYLIGSNNGAIYLQYWRCSVSESDLKLDNYIEEVIRNLILKFNSYNIEEIEKIKRIPLSIMYLETLDNPTSNMVGLMEGSNPYIIFMNKFIIQMFDSITNVEYYDLFGLNNPISYCDKVNYEERIFKIQFVPNTERLNFLNNVNKKRAEEFIIMVGEIFIELYKLNNKNAPNLSLINQVANNYKMFDLPLGVKYSEEGIKLFFKYLFENSFFNT